MIDPHVYGVFAAVVTTLIGVAVAAAVVRRNPRLSLVSVIAVTVVTVGIAIAGWAVSGATIAHYLMVFAWMFFNVVIVMPLMMLAWLGSRRPRDRDDGTEPTCGCVE